MTIAAAFATAAPARAAQPKSHSQMVHDVVDQYVVPHVDKLDAAATQLAADMTSLCQAGSPAALDKAKGSFAAVVSAWAGVEFLRFGPMAESGRVERFAFWPDPRGIVVRQLPPLLAKRDPALLEPGALARQSAAVQGLHALEIVLYDAEQPLTGDPGAHYRCGFASAIAANLKTIAHDLAVAWEDKDGWRHRMFVPGSDNPVYPEPADAARDLVRSLLTGLQLVQERQVQPRRDTMLGLAKPPRLPFERSGLGVAYLTAGAAALQAFDDALAIAAYAPADKAWMKGWSNRAFQLLVRDAPGVPVKAVPPADPAKIDDANPQLRTLRQMRFHLNGLRHMIGRELAPAAGLSIGFNELDGD
jgi:predicted lipoprotein